MNGIKKKIIITPETHWDREWYLPFQEYRAKLVQLIDRLLNLYKTNPRYANFTLDGQTIPLEDYLEVRPGKRAELEMNIQSGKLSVGPFYILPDEFLISGESMIRNLLIGHNIAREFGGDVMKAGYIPDPFGHIAQMPQILAGFDIPSILFARGFDDSFEKLHLDMEFRWNAPGRAASILGIHLVQHYGNCANLNVTVDSKTGKYEAALAHINRVIDKFEPHAATRARILNNGSDHLFAQPEIPDIVEQWNERHGDVGFLEQADFATYTRCVLDDIKDRGIILKEYEGEHHGGRYQQLLSGVFSARMWIKQMNNRCENLLSRYAEPLSVLSWMHGASEGDNRDYIYTGWKWLIKNHPHDSICGCSVDHVHDVDMKTRFYWAEQIALEIVKNSSLEITRLMNFDTRGGERFPVVVYNPTPRVRSGMVSIKYLVDSNLMVTFPPEFIAITGAEGNQIYNFAEEYSLDDRYLKIGMKCFKISFMAGDVPAFGFKTFYILPGEEQELETGALPNATTCNVDTRCIENKFYKITVNRDGSFDLLDKELDVTFKNQGMLEDVGDWGDEYDFSGPSDGQEDKIVLSAGCVKDVVVESFGTVAKAIVRYELDLPEALTGDRKTRSNTYVKNNVVVEISLNQSEKIIYIVGRLDNRSKDHRIRMLFSSGLKSDVVNADGHFYVVPRPVDLPDGTGWVQPPVPTKHQKNFVSVNDGSRAFTVLNAGLPEYAASRNGADGTVDLAITLLRSIGWLSRGDFKSRKGNAGPDLSTPGAQCIGLHEFEVGITTGKGTWLEANAHLRADEFNNPLQLLSPGSLSQSMRQIDAFTIGFGQEERRTGNPVLPNSLSTCAVDGDSFIVSTVKRAENDDNALVIRLVNMASAKQSCTVTVGKTFKNAEIVMLSEEPDSNHVVKASILSASGQSIVLEVGAHVIVTLKVTI
ncbi:MAG: alpha-mannosidase [Promethearchaeota archaeon]